MRRLLLLLFALVLVLAGCNSGTGSEGGEDTADAPADAAEGDAGGAGEFQERLLAAQEATTAAGSAAFTLTQDIGGQTIEGEGAAEFESQKARVSLTAPSGQGGPPQEITTIIDGTMLYVMAPGAPTPWVRIDLENLPEGAGLGGLQDLSNDPSAQIAFLKAAEDVEELGTEQVQGVETTHYSFTVNLAAAAEGLDEDTRAFLDQQRQALGTDRLPAEVWIDEDDLLRRQAYTISIPQPPGGSEAPSGAPQELSTTIEYTDYGVDVDVAPPPEDEITDLAELIGPGGPGGSAPPAPSGSPAPGGPGATEAPSGAGPAASPAPSASPSG